MENRTVMLRVLQGAGIVSLFFTMISGGAGWALILPCALAVPVLEYLLFSRRRGWGSPYLLMLVSPLLLLYYSSVADFQFRMVAFIFFAYILSAAGGGEIRKFPFSLQKSGPAVIWLTAFLLFALVSTVLWLRDIHLSGDEPHYLMIAQSIAEDGDFDLKNNLDTQTYREFVPVELRFHGGRYEGKYLSFHLPGLSFLLVPFYFLFKLLGGASTIPPALFFRLTASIFNAFFALALFYILRGKFPGKDFTGFWLLMIGVYPLAFHSVHLYPELPAAALMMGGFIFSFTRWKNYLVAGFFLGLVPWFHVKYLPPLAVLFLAVVYFIIKPVKPLRLEREKIRKLVHLCLLPLLSGILLIIYCKVLYGTYSPANIFPRESYWSVPWLLRLKVFLSYFLDQRDGLLFYAPLFFTSLWGMKKYNLEGQKLLLAIGGSYVFFHALTSVRGAYAPAGRPLMFISWILIVFIANFYYNNVAAEGGSTFGRRFSYRFLAGWSFFILPWLFYYPLFLYQPVFAATTGRASGLNLFLGSSAVPLWKGFPSFLTSPPGPHPANWVWLIVLVAALVFFYTRKHKPAPSPANAPVSPWRNLSVALLFSGLVFFYCFYPHVHLLPRNKYKGKPLAFFNNSRNFRYVDEHTGFRIKAGNNYDIFIDRKMTPGGKVSFQFQHNGAVDIAVRHGKRLLYRSANEGIKTEAESFTLDISSLGILEMAGKQVSHLGIETVSSQEHAFINLKIE